MIKFLKRNWFGVIVGAAAFCYLCIFLLVLFSPRRDELNRGFIPCTKAMAGEMFSCRENKIWCMAAAVVKNSVCDARVVWKGLTDWVDGRQPAPWSNYLFEPVIAIQENPDESLAEYYAEHPDTLTDMQQLDRERRELERDLNNSMRRLVPLRPAEGEKEDFIRLYKEQAAGTENREQAEETPAGDPAVRQDKTGDKK